MGNQLTGIAPSQILPVDHYLQDATDYEFDSSLGSTRFFKVATARCGEGLVVVKVFVIHDPSLPLKTYKDGIEKLGCILNSASNVLPFQRATLSDKAAMLFRQYIKDSLYDRISTRPFLSPIEKQFLAFQLLCALNQCHGLGVCHGDIKSENVLVSSWNWVMLADFASFKPTYLPEDNPADFSYFFDTSRRRTCYIAPERFVKSSRELEDSQKESGGSKGTGSIDLPTGDVQKGELTPAMDIFSAGCVITELFTEGSPPFDLSQLLAYREGVYTPSALVQKIDNVYIRDLVRHMMQKDPQDRLSAEEYMIQQKGRAFPDYFYNFLKFYLQRFASPPILSPDERVQRIKRDMSIILEKLVVSKTNPESNSALLLIISMVTAAQRNLRFLKCKLTALELLLELAGYVTADVVLERIVPMMLIMVNDSYPQVRCEAIRTITLCLSDIKTVPLTEANIFPEYILPQMAHLTGDSSAAVRVTYARNIATLSHTALRFLEIVQLNSQPVTFSSEVTGSGSVLATDMSQSKASYETELRTLHEMVQKKVVTLLSDPDNAVKRTLLEHGITQLCVFFGRQKANDTLLSHMITFLNNKEDWQLRGAFFDAIVGIAAFVGLHSSLILKPLLQQGLSDSEEFVVHKTLSALQSLVEQSLIQKPIKYELLTEVRLSLCHPNQWIRQAAVGFVSALARSMNIADVHCNVMPAIQPFLQQKIRQVQDDQVLLSCLSPPIPRAVYDYILRSPHTDRLFDCLNDRKLVRSFCRPGHSPQYSELDNTMGQVMRKLQSEGMSQEDEARLLMMRELMVKLSRARASSEPPGSEGERAGCVDLKSGLSSAKYRHADLKKIGENKSDPQNVIKKPQSRKKASGADSTTIMSEDWKQMFGTSDIQAATSNAALKKTSSGTPSSRGHKKEGSPSSSVSRTIEIPPLGWGPYNEPGGQVNPEITSSNTEHSTTEPPVAITQKFAGCRFDLQCLVYHKKDLFTADETTKDVMSQMEWERRPPPAAWKPQGLLVAHLHEHRGAVNRVKVNQDHTYFATCSNDASVKVFDSMKMEGKSVTNRSRMTFNKSEGQVKTLTFCESSQSIAFVADKGDSGTLNVFRIETSGPHKYTVLQSSELPVEKDGMVVDLSYLDHSSQNVLVYTTVHGYIIGRDLRAGNKETWRLHNDPKQGLVTTFDVHPNRSWMVLGTSNGTMVCWDMRFHLPVTSIVHPTSARCRRILTHPAKSSTIISAMQGNNEISFWDLETGSRQRTLWASTAPPLSQTKATNHSVNGLYFGKTDSNSFLLAAGSDMRVRYWDLDYAANSQLVTGAASDPPQNPTAVSYRSRLIEGTEVVQETYSKPKVQGDDQQARKGPEAPPSGHHDIITDVSVCQPASQCFMITASRDGVVKVWK